MQKKNKILGITYLFITAIIWGGCFVPQKVGGSTVGPYLFIVYRCLIGCPVIAILIFIDTFAKTGKLSFFRDDEDVKLTIKYSFQGGILLFISMALQQAGVVFTDVAKSGLISSLEVIFVPIICMLLFKKKISLLLWIFIITSFFGIYLLSAGSISGFNFGDFLMFFSAISYAGTIVQLERNILKTDALKITFFRFVFVGIFAYIFANIFTRDLLPIKYFVAAFPSLLCCGVLSSGIAYSLQGLGQKHCDSVIAALIMGLEGVFAAIFGWIFLGESLTFVQILGCIIAIVSTSLVQLIDYYETAGTPIK